MQRLGENLTQCCFWEISSLGGVLFLWTKYRQTAEVFSVAPPESCQEPKPNLGVQQSLGGTSPCLTTQAPSWRCRGQHADTSFLLLLRNRPVTICCVDGIQHKDRAEARELTTMHSALHKTTPWPSSSKPQRTTMFSVMHPGKTPIQTCYVEATMALTSFLFAQSLWSDSHKIIMHTQSMVFHQEKHNFRSPSCAQYTSHYKNRRKKKSCRLQIFKHLFLKEPFCVCRTAQYNWL